MSDIYDGRACNETVTTGHVFLVQPRSTRARRASCHLSQVYQSFRAEELISLGRIEQLRTPMAIDFAGIPFGSAPTILELLQELDGDTQIVLDVHRRSLAAN